MIGYSAHQNIWKDPCVLQFCSDVRDSLLLLNNVVLQALCLLGLLQQLQRSPAVMSEHKHGETEKCLLIFTLCLKKEKQICSFWVIGLIDAQGGGPHMNRSGIQGYNPSDQCRMIYPDPDHACQRSGARYQP